MDEPGLGWPVRRYVQLTTERTVERFLLRLFLRETPLRGLCIVTPFMAPLSTSRFSLSDLRRKVEREKVPTYVITREPSEAYQHEAMAAVLGSPWIEVRYNAAIHAKLYVASMERETESFALFGSGNLTTRSIESNVELGMLVYSEGPGRELLRELHYWASVRLRLLPESKLVQPIRSYGR
jgi:phosphatidylserine/phosphatidylglycerophosphate/cardiolipin synthase-like enzyme